MVGAVGMAVGVRVVGAFVGTFVGAFVRPMLGTGVGDDGVKDSGEVVGTGVPCGFICT